MQIETRELRIIFQNALAHATQISVHNAKMTESAVEPAEVISLAKEIAKAVVMIGVKESK